MFLRIPDEAPAFVAPAYRRSLDTLSRIYARQDRPKGGINTVLVAVAASVAGLIVLVLLVIQLRSLRAQHPEPKYIPTPFLKKLWKKWTPSNMRYMQPQSEGNGRWGGTQRGATGGGHGSNDTNLASEPMRSSAPATSTIDRNTSVRSVMTLPAYRAKAADAEQVLGVEGERDGIDLVVEMPTAEEEEALRDDEMEGLFQIREARRRQAAEREARNQRREQARAANDVAAMRTLRDEARAARAANADEIEALRGIQDQVKQTRQRAVSSVSYADVGVVRHDGTRARANSNESERMGLLSDAASIAAHSVAASRPSTSLSDRRSVALGRPRSSSVLSFETARSQPGSPGHSPGNSPGLSPNLSRRSRASSRPRRLSSASTTHAGSSPEMIDAAEADLGSGFLPHQSPPGYDDVSLTDETTGSYHNVSRPGSALATPSTPSFHEPPPDYPGPSPERRSSRHLAPPHSAASTSGSPQLPSLSFQTLPQIVIEPSTARPSDNNDRRNSDVFR